MAIDKRNQLLHNKVSNPMYSPSREEMLQTAKQQDYLQGQIELIKDNLVGAQAFSSRANTSQAQSRLATTAAIYSSKSKKLSRNLTMNNFNLRPKEELDIVHALTSRNAQTGNPETRRQMSFQPEALNKPLTSHS